MLIKGLQFNSGFLEVRCANCSIMEDGHYEWAENPEQKHIDMLLEAAKEPDDPENTPEQNEYRRDRLLKQAAFIKEWLGRPPLKTTMPSIGYQMPKAVTEAEELEPLSQPPRSPVQYHDDITKEDRRRLKLSPNDEGCNNPLYGQ